MRINIPIRYQEIRLLPWLHIICVIVTLSWHQSTFELSVHSLDAMIMIEMRIRSLDLILKILGDIFVVSFKNLLKSDCRGVGARGELHECVAM